MNHIANKPSGIFDRGLCFGGKEGDFLVQKPKQSNCVNCKTGRLSKETLRTVKEIS